MSFREDLPSIVVLGDGSQAGSYLLRIHVHQDLCLRFGRFKKGKKITLPAGEYLYVGSALAERGAMSLGHRLVRHATRSGEKKPQKIRADMLAFFKTIGLGAGNRVPKSGKTLFWNIDYLLDHTAVDLIGVFIIRSAISLERELGHYFEHQSSTEVIEKRLGASDLAGHTHILRVRADAAWWHALPDQLQDLIQSVAISGGGPAFPSQPHVQVIAFAQRLVEGDFLHHEMGWLDLDLPYRSGMTGVKMAARAATTLRSPISG